MKASHLFSAVGIHQRRRQERKRRVSVRGTRVRGNESQRERARKKGNKDNCTSAKKGERLDLFGLLLRDWLPLPPCRLFATTPADVYSFRHGDLCDVSRHVELG